MTKSSYLNDSPIDSPDDDAFGVDTFAKVIASSIETMASPIGTTIAINGKWGSGKSSVVNLIQHYLKPAVANDKLAVIDFKCWWFRGEEALTLAFLQELNTELDKSLGQKVKELVPKLGKALLRTGPIVGAAANFAFTGPTWGLLGKGIDFSKQFFQDTESVESVFNDLSSALDQQDKRFLIIIDDIDRLTPDEALLIFRLVKSVGRLPNVIYLLVFDRELAEDAVNKKYPSEGPHFLEKIIQAGFDVPHPSQDDLNDAVLRAIEAQCGAPSSVEDLKDFMNLYYEVVAPLISTPRDIVKLSNSITVSWAAVAGEVNLGDYIAVEAIRIFETKVYQAIIKNKSRICGLGDSTYVEDDREQVLESLVALASEKNKETIRSGLIRIFPRLENMGYAPEFLSHWQASRRVCTEEHFETYFRMALGDDTLSLKEIDEFIAKCGNSNWVKDALMSAAKTVRKNGKSNVPLLFDELILHSSRVEKEKFKPLLCAVFEMADEIYRDEDAERGMLSFGNTELRIHWLIRALTFNRCSLEERSALFLIACKNASLSWLINFVSSAWEDYHPPQEGKPPEPSEKCLVTSGHLEELVALALNQIQVAAEDGRLITNHNLASLLYAWNKFGDDNSMDIKAWVTKQLADGVNVALLARAFTGESWSQGLGFGGLGDHVSVRRTTANIERLSSIMDTVIFRERLEEVLQQNELEGHYMDMISAFLEAWKEKESGDIS